MHEQPRLATGQGEPNGVYVLPLTDIHYLCNCTWVFDHVYGMNRLKYRSMACPVQSWHSSLSKAAA